jgi:hypothetical protein
MPKASSIWPKLCSSWFTLSILNLGDLDLVQARIVYTGVFDLV